jgi:mevalonate kinase
MNVSKDALFYAKILLFGEYGIIRDSMGLSIPFNYYEGALREAPSSPTKEQIESTGHIWSYLEHLRGLEAKSELPCELNLNALESDLDQGMYFDSSIPQGFGVGSSGALVAAIYDSYAIDKIESSAHLVQEDIKKLKRILGQMEAYFHGKSSGLDPLICYLRLPVLIKSSEDLDTVQLPAQSDGRGGIFLLNSGAPGSTQSMVNIFMEKMKHEGFRHMLKDQFIRYNDACIHSFLKGELRGLFRNLKKLSTVLLDNFDPMIPQHFQELWKRGIDSGDYYLKLCGSGGGGFILGFTEDYEKAQELLSDYRPELIQRL